MSLGIRLLKNTGYLTIGNQVGNLLQFIFFLYFAKQFGEGTVGKYSFAYSFTFVFAIFADSAISTYLIREVARNKGERQIFFDCLLFRLVGTIGITILALTMVRFCFPTFSHEQLKIIALLGFYQIFLILADIFMGEFKAYEKMGLVSLLNIILRTIVATLGCGLIFFGFNYITVLWVFPIAALIYLSLVLGLSIRLFGPIRLPIDTFENYKLHFKNILPFSLTIITVELLFCQDIFILKLLQGDESVGLYSVGTKIAGVFLGMSVLIHTAILPIFSSLYAESRSRLIEFSEEILRVLITLGLPISVGLVCAADRIITLLYQDSFQGSIMVLRIVGWVVCFGLVQIPFSVLLTATNHQKEKMLSMGGILIVSVLLNLLLVPYFDYLGVSIVRLLIEIMTLIVFIFLVARYLSFLPTLNLFAKPALACGIMALSFHVMKSINLPFAVLSSATIYFISLAFLGGFNKEQFVVMTILRR